MRWHDHAYLSGVILSRLDLRTSSLHVGSFDFVIANVRLVVVKVVVVKVVVVVVVVAVVVVVVVAFVIRVNFNVLLIWYVFEM
jgi:hypothetical protein